MTTAQSIEIIDSGWKASIIADAVRLGLSELPPIDPFNVIDPILEGEPDIGNHHLLAIARQILSIVRKKSRCYRRR